MKKSKQSINSTSNKITCFLNLHRPHLINYKIHASIRISFKTSYEFHMDGFTRFLETEYLHVLLELCAFKGFENSINFYKTHPHIFISMCISTNSSDFLLTFITLQTDISNQMVFPISNKN